MTSSLKVKDHLITSTGTGNFARLRTLAQQHDRDVNQVTVRFALESALRRIFASEHADQFGMTSAKGGALMFFHEGVDPLDGRATRDIDIQIGAFQGTMDDLKDIMRQVLAEVPVNDDGVRFDVDALTITGTRDGGVPGGTIETTAQIGRAVVRFKCDVGFYSMDDRDELEIREYPSLLGDRLGSFPIYCQPLEFSVADKIHAAVRHGGATGRLRDFYDLAVYCRGDLDDDRIRRGLERTFALYGGEMPASIDDIPAFGAEFTSANAEAWERLRAKSGWAVEVPDLPATMAIIAARLGPTLNPTSYGARA